MKAKPPLLFDLQALLFWAGDRVPAAVTQAVLTGAKVHVSSISLWEFVLKQNRYSFDIDFFELMGTVDHLDAQILPIKKEHLMRLRLMPIIEGNNGKDHNDPFDRLLVAQAIEEDFVLVGADKMFPIYRAELGVKLLWEA